MSGSEEKDSLEARPASSHQKRKSERRSGHDQREMIRFELEKSDRRSGDDRREEATSWGADDPV